jgi:hypothetical protein
MSKRKREQLAFLGALICFEGLALAIAVAVVLRGANTALGAMALVVTQGLLALYFYSAR